MAPKVASVPQKHQNTASSQNCGNGKEQPGTVHAFRRRITNPEHQKRLVAQRAE
jgi:hypothetical protein